MGDINRDEAVGVSDVLVRGVPEATPEDYQRSREAMVDLGDDDAMRAAWS